MELLIVWFLDILTKMTGVFVYLSGVIASYVTCSPKMVLELSYSVRKEVQIFHVETSKHIYISARRSKTRKEPSHNLNQERLLG